MIQHEPTVFEQALLEYVNRARTSPGGEFDRVIADAAAGTGVQGDITSALDYFGVDLEAFRRQMADFDPVAPLAWNDALAAAADAHGALMIEQDDQSHLLEGEAGLLERIEAAGYENLSWVAENVFAYSNNPLHAHAGFMIDWGFDDIDRDGAGRLRDGWQSLGDGIQDPAGHRNTILSDNYADIGISVIPESDPNSDVGPYVVTQNFGSIFGHNPAQLLGVFLDDADGDRFYDIGEGQGAITVIASGASGTFFTETWDAGGYQVELPAGDYAVQFSGPGLGGVAQYQTSIGDENVKIDGFVADLQQGGTAQFGDGLAAVYFSDVAAQVFRLYQATLGREPDAEGHAAWTGAIAVAGRALAEVAEGFVTSPEFEARYGALDNADFVRLLYDNVLGRAADATGLANWTARLDGGMSRAEVVRGFSESNEFRAATRAAAQDFAEQAADQSWGDDVFRLYRATLDRAPDLDGFLSWAGRLADGTSYLEVAERFTLSQEFKAAYDTLANSDFVRMLYDNVLGRAADATGLANWTARLDGGMSRAEVVRGFAQSSEFRVATAEDLEEWIRDQGQDDLLIGGAGETVLAGGILSDTFVFAPVQGDSVVLDLEPWDRIDLRAFGFEDVDEAGDHFEQQGNDVVFDDADGTRVRFQDSLLAQIDDEMIWV